jgi:hypothetical protein
MAKGANGRRPRLIRVPPGLRDILCAIAVSRRRLWSSSSAAFAS